MARVRSQRDVNGRADPFAVRGIFRQETKSPATGAGPTNTGMTSGRYWRQHAAQSRHGSSAVTTVATLAFCPIRTAMSGISACQQSHGHRPTATERPVRPHVFPSLSLLNLRPALRHEAFPPPAERTRAPPRRATAQRPVRRVTERNAPSQLKIEVFGINPRKNIHQYFKKASWQC